MQKANVKVARPVRVILNTANRNGAQWAQIREGSKILHTGRVPYIKRVAKTRYNTIVEVR
jgi:hypothetical protein